MDNMTMEDYLNKKDTVQDQMDDLIFELIKARKEQGITKEQLSQLAGIPLHTIAAYEGFQIHPTLETLIKAANALQCAITIQKQS